MEVKIKIGDEIIDAKIVMMNGDMIVSPKVEYVPKDGDILIGGNRSEGTGNYWIFILKGEIKDEFDGCMSANEYASVEKSGSLEIDSDSDSMKWYRPATEEEKKKLFDKLKENGYEWDAEKKELVKLKWKPKYREPYFAPFFSNVDFLFSTCGHTYTEHFSDELTIKRTRVFKTEGECQAFCDRLNDAINSVML